MKLLRLLTLVAASQLARASLLAQQTTAPGGAPQTEALPGDSVAVRIVNVDLRTAVQMLSQYLDRPVMFSSGGTNQPVTLEAPRPVPRADVLRLLRGLVESQGYELATDTTSGTYRVRTRDAAARGGPSGPPAANPGAQGRGAAPAAPLELFSIPLKHARAADVAGTINALFGKTSSSVGTQGSGRAPTLGDELRATQSQSGPAQSAAPAPASAGASESSSSTGGRSATLTGELTVVPDNHINMLMVRANRTDFALIQSAVEQLDVRPLQVLIEVLIVEASRDLSSSFGVDISVDSQAVGKKHAAVSGTLSSGLGLGDFALSVMGLGGNALDAQLSAAASHGAVHIVSRPTVLSANNAVAQMIVGSQQPFVQLARTLPTDNSATDQVVQYKDVGTKLTVLPTISVDGSVEMEVTQEVSNATNETEFNAPVISTRSVSTDLLVRDGQTVVLGGLNSHEHDTGQGGLPFLSSIPIIGALFGHLTRSTMDDELLIFITPHVIRSDADAAALSDSLRKRAEIIKR